MVSSAGSVLKKGTEVLNSGNITLVSNLFDEIFVLIFNRNHRCFQEGEHMEKIHSKQNELLLMVRWTIPDFMILNDPLEKLKTYQNLRPVIFKYSMDNSQKFGRTHKLERRSTAPSKYHHRIFRWKLRKAIIWKSIL